MKHGFQFFILFCFGISQHTLLAQQYDPPSNDREFEKQYQERIKKDRLNGIYIPRNLDDALAQLDKLTSDDAKKIYKNIPEDTICLLMHNRLGQWMIVNWSFYEGSRLSNYLRSAGVSYPDDMADFVLLAYHRHLHGKPVSIKEFAELFHEKRKTEWRSQVEDGEILREEVRQRPKPNSNPAATPPAAKPGTSKDSLSPKGGGGKQ